MKKSDTPVIKDKLLSPDPIFQMVIGFWISKSLMTAFELDLFTKLSNRKAVTLEQLRTDILGMERRPADVFVTALISLGLLDTTVTNNEYEEKESNKRLLYSNSEISEEFLNKNRPGYIGEFIIMMDKHLYNRWDKIVHSLKTNKPVEEVWGQASGQDMYELAKTNRGIEQIQMFTHSMYSISAGPAMMLPKVFDFSRYNKMMDIGGGSGVYSIQVAKSNPNISAVVMDLQSVCNVASQYIRDYNLQDRIQTKVIDFFD